MGADLSRVRLDPLLDYAGIELKQGGVLLDADANELVGILDRRLRALASDVLDRERVSSTTPDAFRITVSGTALGIGIGRLYVDGLLAECHGAPDPAGLRFDDLLAEPIFTDPVPYEAQPYLPNPPALPTAGRHLVYLDVWDREVTQIEQPALVESAVNVETSSRRQTVWQVRALDDDAGNATCATPDEEIPGWPAVIAPSTGVLTTGTFEVAPVDDPCELPPTGGYRGLENQLYRVEIHDPGQPGAGATFKWSRENASVGSRVANVVSAGELELETLGRDDVLSFKTNDWVEITDDRREFAQTAGEIRRITVDEAIRRIQFTPDLPADMLPGSFPDSALPQVRNMRVRRWDQKGRVFRTDASGTPVEVQNLDAAGSTGVIDVPAATVTLLLENGLTVAFDTTGPEGFHAGNYWVFAARTADASVELLDRAPPRGIHHHYARLGIWDVGAGTVTDCRDPWPPPGGEGHDCSCTVCVTAESHGSGTLTIQDAVNQALQTGGTVCIGPGQFVLREAVQVVGRALRIRGQGPATILVATSGAFAVRNSIGIAVESLAILALATRPAIGVNNVLGLALRQLVIAVIGNADQRASAIALQGVIAGASIAENVVFGPSGIVANDPALPLDDNAPRFVLAAELAIEKNVLWCSRQGVALDGTVLHFQNTRISANEVVTSTQAGISALGRGLPGASMHIEGNSLSLPGNGIRCAVDGARIDGNRLTSSAQAGADQIGASGITLAVGAAREGVKRAQILANQITGFPTAGILVAAPVRDLIVKLNIIDRSAIGILAGDAGGTGAVSIENNHLRDIGATAAAAVGIGVTRGDSATIAGNTLRGIGQQAPDAALRAGIVTIGVRRPRVQGNTAIGIAPAGNFTGQAVGILLVTMIEAEVSGNRVEREADLGPVPSNGQWTALDIGDFPRAGAGNAPAPNAGPVFRAGDFVAVRLDNARAMVLGAGRAHIANLSAVTNEFAGANAVIIGNVLNARGNAPAVRVSVRECQFSDNRVDARLNGNIAVIISAPAGRHELEPHHRAGAVRQPADLEPRLGGGARQHHHQGNCDLGLGLAGALECAQPAGLRSNPSCAPSSLPAKPTCSRCAAA